MAQKIDGQDSDVSGQDDVLLARRFAWVFGVLAVVLMGFVIWAGRDWRLASNKVFGVVDMADKVPTETYVKWGMWWAGMVNALICVVLALTAKWWAGKKFVALALISRRITKREWLWLIMVLAAAGGLRWARMDLSFYNDEAHTFRTYVAGRFRQSDDGQVAWKQLKWLDTFWLNKLGNNLMPCSVFGRLSYDAWRKITHAPVGAVSETAVRLPQWIAGMMALAVLWLAVRRMLGAQVALVALVLMALHPWAVRYSSEARAYGMLMLGIALCFYFLQRAFEDGRWRWWLGLGLAEFFCVWSFTGVVFFLIVFNTAILIRSVAQWKRGGDGRMALRPLLGMLVGGMLSLQLMLPTLPQLMGAMNLNSLKGEMGAAWWSDVMGGLLWGTRGRDGDPANPLNLALGRMLGQQPMLWVVLAIEVGLFVVGFIALVRKGGAGRILALAGPVALVMGWMMMALRGKYLHSWYVIYEIHGLIICISFGFKCITNLLHEKMIIKWVATLLIIALSVSWLSVDYLYAGRGKENIRGISETARRSELSTEASRGLFATMLSDVNIYDPLVLPLKSVENLEELIARSRREGLLLTVSVGRVGMGDTVLVLKHLEESGDFERVATLWGMEESQFTHHIFRLRQSR